MFSRKKKDEYTYITWGHFDVKKDGDKLPIVGLGRSKKVNVALVLKKEKTKLTFVE